jgi:hypothetical protein
LAKQTQPEQSVYARRLSPNQYAVMRAVAHGEIKHGMDTLRILNYVTVGALLRRNPPYLAFDGRQNLIFTLAGLQAFETYENMEMPHRAHPADVPKLVADMLGIKTRRNGGAA